MGLLETAFSVEALHESFMEIHKDISFKYSVQYYRVNELDEIYAFREAYKNGTFRFSKSKPFQLNERGHIRYIQPNIFRDRVVIHSFVKNILMKELQKYLIYDNCASIKGKGVDQQLDRFGVHLKKAYRHWNTDCYILQGDFSKYFDNLRHEVIIDLVREKIPDEEVISFLRLILKEYRIDASLMSDEEYEEAFNGIFNSLEYIKKNHSNLGLRYIDKTVGIGNEVSQICGLFYLYKIDNYIKIVKGIKYYGRYMDDFYIIHNDKQFLIKLLNEIREEVGKIGICLSVKKTHINKIIKPIKFLKVKFLLSPTGKIIRIKHKDIFTRERRKLKKYKEMLERKDITYNAIEMQYSSWRGNIIRKRKDYKDYKYKKILYKNYKQTINIDKLYDELFIIPFINGGY